MKNSVEDFENDLLTLTFIYQIFINCSGTSLPCIINLSFKHVLAQKFKGNIGCLVVADHIFQQLWFPCSISVVLFITPIVDLPFEVSDLKKSWTMLFERYLGKIKLNVVKGAHWWLFRRKRCMCRVRTINNGSNTPRIATHAHYKACWCGLHKLL